jgi:hypothetical protein
LFVAKQIKLKPISVKGIINIGAALDIVKQLILGQRTVIITTDRMI